MPRTWTNNSGLALDAGNLNAMEADITTALSREPALPSGNSTQYLRGDKTMQTLNKAAVGLANADNTADANKPISTPQAEAMVTAVVAIGAGIDYTGATDSTTAVQAKLTAASTSSFGKVVYLASGTLQCANLTLPVGVSLYGFGTTLKAPSAATTPILTISGGLRSTVEGIVFAGNQAAGTAISLGATNGTQEGIRLNGASEQVTITRCTFMNFGHSGIRIQAVGNTTSGNRITGTPNKITDCHAENCYHGFFLDTRGEYVTLTGNSAILNRFGYKVHGGNTTLNNCHGNGNALGLHVAVDTNSGHGSATGCTFNHNTITAAQVDEATNGFVFTGCQFFDTKLLLYRAKGVVFNACEFGGGLAIQAQGGGKNIITDSYALSATMAHNHAGETSATTLTNVFKPDGTALT